mgnify:CR=1 FL=1
MSYYIQNEEKMMDIALDRNFNGQVIDLESLKGYIRFTDDGGEERDYSNYINTYSITFNSGKNNRIAINISSFNFEHSRSGTYLWDRLVITADDEIENLNKNFLNPEIFDITRDCKASIAFGAGPHFCAGAWASKTLITEVVLPLIFDMLPNLKLDPDYSIEYTGWAFRGPLAVNVIWD